MKKLGQCCKSALCRPKPNLVSTSQYYVSISTTIEVVLKVKAVDQTSYANSGCHRYLLELHFFRNCESSIHSYEKNA